MRPLLVNRVPDIADEQRVSVIILNYLNWEETCRCVDQLTSQTQPNLDIVVVDNHSPNSSFERLQERFQTKNKVSVILADSNRGYAAGNNCGIRWRQAQGPVNFFLIANNDIALPDPDTIRCLVQFACRNVRTGIVGPRVVSERGFSQGPYSQPRLPIYCLRYCFPLGPYLFRLWRRVFPGTYASGPQYAVVGACFLVRSKCLSDVGYFDEATFLGAEEYILAERLSRKGFDVAYCRDVTIVHNHQRSSITRTGGEARYFSNGLDSMCYYFRNYRNASDLGLWMLRTCAAFYERAFLPLRKHIPL
jgi:GT2 family glycosyltransferase